jgi:aminoglycoside 6'-N-acetyltransferase
MEVSLRPLEESDVEAVVAIVHEPSVSRWWGPLGDDDALRDELRSGGDAFAVCVDGGLAGWLGVWEEREPDYRHAGLDVVLTTAHQDAGVGRAALRLAVRRLIDERGLRRFTIDPAAANARAIRCYEAVGFRPVGIMRGYERGADGSWHDNLLMDLLAEELTEPET